MEAPSGGGVAGGAVAATVQEEQQEQQQHGSQGGQGLGDQDAAAGEQQQQQDEEGSGEQQQQQEAPGWQGRRPRVLLAATGSVASVKLGQLAAELLHFAEVRVVATRSARRFFQDTELPPDCGPVLGEAR